MTAFLTRSELEENCKSLHCTDRDCVPVVADVSSAFAQGDAQVHVDAVDGSKNKAGSPVAEPTKQKKKKKKKKEKKLKKAEECADARFLYQIVFRRREIVLLCFSFSERHFH